MNLDYASMPALAAVVREGSFERAARALHVTPPAVSQRVRLLELLRHNLRSSQAFVTATKRSKVRAQVHQLEIAAESGVSEIELRELATKASQHVGRLARFHMRSGELLRDRAKVIRAKIAEQKRSCTTFPTDSLEIDAHVDRELKTP